MNQLRSFGSFRFSIASSKTIHTRGIYSNIRTFSPAWKPIGLQSQNILSISKIGPLYRWPRLFPRLGEPIILGNGIRYFSIAAQIPYRPKKISVILLLLIALLIASPLAFILFVRPPGGGIDFAPTSQNLYATFRDTSLLFRHKSTAELYYTLFVFRLCQIQAFIDYGPKILEKAEKWGISDPIYNIIKKTFFKQFCAGENFQEMEEYIKMFQNRRIGIIIDSSSEDSMTVESWESNTSTKLALLEKASTMKGVTFVPVKVTSICSPLLLEKMTEIIRANPAGSDIDWKIFLSAQEINEMKDLLSRLDRILESSKKVKIPILLDAEQTFRQPAVDYFALIESKKWNKDGLVIYNTYQMYLKSSLPNLIRHLELSKKEDFYLGVKLVRGAYIFSEKKRAEEMAYESPIQSTKTLTDTNYGLGLSHVLSRMRDKQKCGLVVASHNLGSVMQAANMCAIGRIPFDSPNLHFAQLKGMADHISAGLEHAKFNVSKLMPYGSVREVVPYLIRRMQENRDIFGGTQLERELMWIELKRRRFGFKQ